MGVPRLLRQTRLSQTSKQQKSRDRYHGFFIARHQYVAAEKQKAFSAGKRLLICSLHSAYFSLVSL
jgi:hypothetical protein